ncbi:MAG TPA: DoxX family protein [Chloroflexota bacterium]|nr:DoxX family protein [Chloroflexota bacterium]
MASDTGTWPRFGRFTAGTVDDPPFTRFLFSDPRMAWVWLPVRLFVSYQWLTSGWGKISNPAWTETGTALRGFWERAAALPTAPGAKPPITFDWYRSFLEFLLAGNHHTWFGPMVAFGEVAIGLGLLLGAFTGIAAFFGAFMNLNFMLAGTASTNPILFLLQISLMLAWKIAGLFGLDYWLLRWIGTPWRPGAIAGHRVDRPTDELAARRVAA